MDSNWLGIEGMQCMHLVNFFHTYSFVELDTSLGWDAPPSFA